MANETPVQAEVVFVIEDTAANELYFNELKTNYVIPTLEYFHGGALEDGGGTGSTYGIVAYHTADCHPAPVVEAYGPFSNPQNILQVMDSLEFVGGHSETRSCMIEALTTAVECFDDSRAEVQKHIIMLSTSPPYTAYCGGLVPPGAPSTIEQAARAVAERGIHLSVTASKKIPALLSVYEHAGGDLHAAQQRTYAKDPRHLVLLKGYTLQERPPSPAPPPVPEIQTDIYSRGAPVPGTGPRARAPPPRAAWLQPPAPRQPLYANNSALLTQLSQPSYPPPPSHAQQTSMQRMPGPAGPPAGGPTTPGGIQPRTFIWSGVLEWMEKVKTPGDQQKVTKQLPCQVSANTKDIEPELKADTWPNKLLMQIMPKQLISNIGGQYIKDSKSVLFHMQPSEVLDALTKVMVSGFAGCVHFSSMTSSLQCDIKVLILLYTADKKAFLGFIPNNQATFVDRLRKLIQQQKITQIMNKQLPAGGAPGVPGALPSSSMPGMSTAGLTQAGMSTAGMTTAGMNPVGAMASAVMNPGPMASSTMNPGGMTSSGMAGMSNPAGMAASGMNPGSMAASGMAPGVMNPGMSPGMAQMAVPGAAQGMVQSQLQQHSQGMMMGRGGGQLEGLEAARQHNLDKIQALQHTLDAAHHQEAHFKSQMDIMNQISVAQHHEHHYKQLEEQQRKHQLQQQLQQQLRGAGLPRAMRPAAPANPGLRHLLQQQPYRTGGPSRPPSQPQQYDDVSNYSDFL